MWFVQRLVHSMDTTSRQALVSYPSSGRHLFVGAGLVDIRAISGFLCVGLTHEWGAQRLVYSIDTPSWQAPCASKLAQGGSLIMEGQAVSAAYLYRSAVVVRAKGAQVKSAGRHSWHQVSLRWMQGGSMP